MLAGVREHGYVVRTEYVTIGAMTVWSSHGKVFADVDRCHQPPVGPQWMDSSSELSHRLGRSGGMSGLLSLP
jgi:hypothetical protein